MPRTKGRRPARSAGFRRWLAVGALLLIALLYYRPLKAYIASRSELGQRSQIVHRLEAEKVLLDKRLGSSTSVATLARVRPEGRAPLHRQGHQPVAEARAGQHDGPPWTLTSTARLSPGRSAVSRGRSAASRSAARSDGRP